MDILTEAPKASSFIPLAEHQSATPASFYDGPAVLHYYSDRCKLIVLEHEVSTSPALANLVAKESGSSQTAAPQTNGGDSDVEDRQVIDDVDVWVTSDKLFVFSPSLNTGLSIPYPSISLHAIQSQPTSSNAPDSETATNLPGRGLYMQLISSSDGNSTQNEDLEPESISLTIIPTASAPPTASVPSSAIDAELETEDVPEQTPVVAMFTALSNCSNLHPDPVEDDDMDVDEDGGLVGSTLYQSGLVMPGGEDGGLPPPMPGSGGWITAENMHEFIDADGNWIASENDGGEGEDEDEDGPGAEGLGPGAGTTRQRNDDAGNNGGDETKWRRTD